MVENTPALKSWIPYDQNNNFPLENIPFGVFTNPKNGKVRCCTRIGDFIIDLSELEHARLFDGPLFVAFNDHVFCEKTLNKFAALGKTFRIEVRSTLQKIFGSEGSLSDEMKEKAMVDHKGVKMHLPVFVRDYTDFYSSKNHAYNVGVMIRGPENALQANWLHLPVGYHGRASSIVIDGTPVRRPRGQVSADKITPSFSSCARLDLELEMGTVIAVPNEMGHPIKVNYAKDHIFGHTLLNDQSARDL